MEEVFRGIVAEIRYHFLSVTLSRYPCKTESPRDVQKGVVEILSRIRADMELGSSFSKSVAGRAATCIREDGVQGMV